MNSWHREIISIVLILLATIAIGSYTGLFWQLLYLTLLVILIRQIYQINRLVEWLRAGGTAEYPKCKGIWEEVYYHLYRIKKADKRRKRKLSKMVDQFRKSTAALPDAAVVLGGNDEIEWSNKAARQVLGLQKRDKGMRILNLIRHPEFNQYLKSKDTDKTTVTMPSPVDENMILEYRVVPYGGGLRLLLAHDVTQLKRMERMRKDFVANVSHELRTPLTVLKGYLETITDMGADNSGLLTNSLQQMLAQTERMQHLTDDLLLLARLETQSKKMHNVNIPELLQQLCQEMNNLHSSEGRIQLAVDSNTRISGSDQELRSAFTNLLENALKYSEQNSVVKVRWYRDQDSVKLDVEDQGQGIAAGEIHRITERFYRVDAKRNGKTSGTGLGLAIVKHILARHDAELKITSIPGKGSCFSCVFPSKQVIQETAGSR